MTTIGNLILCLATLFYAGLVFTLFKKPGSADAAMGYAWLGVIFNLLMLACLIIASGIISRSGGFTWISHSRFARLMLVALGLLVAIGTTILCTVFANEKAGMPAIFRVLVIVVPVVIPMVLILAATVLLNNKLRASVPVAAYRWPLAAVFIIGLAGIGITRYTYTIERGQEERSHQAKHRINALNDNQSN